MPGLKQRIEKKSMNSNSFCGMEDMNLEKQLSDCIRKLEKEKRKMFRDRNQEDWILTNAELQAHKSDLKKLEKAREEIVEGIEKLKDHHSPYSGIVNANIDQTLSIINKILGDGKEKGE